MKQEKETGIPEEKKKTVKELANLIRKKTIIVVSIKGLPDAMFQNIKKKLRGKVIVKVAKKNLIDFALEHSLNKNLRELERYIKEDSAILFSDEDAFEISKFLSENKVPARAKIGQIAPENIKVEAGPTDLMPGPDISALSSVGLKPKVEGGKIVILEPRVLIKKGEEISESKASILNKLNITPFEIGLEPLVAFQDGKIYTNIKIDKKAYLKELEDNFWGGLAFAVSINYITKETLPYILSKAVAHESAINGLIKEKPEKKEENNEKNQENKLEGIK